MEEKIRGFVKEWAERLELQDWVIDIRFETLAGTDVADIESNSLSRRAVLSVDPRFAEDSRRSLMSGNEETEEHILESCVVHELLHLAGEPFEDHLRSFLGTHLGHAGILGQAWQKALDDYSELWIRRLERVLVPG